jgi:hypothetical protein
MALSAPWSTAGFFSLIFKPAYPNDERLQKLFEVLARAFIEQIA